ncbi:MAG: hypothetical protein ACE5G8_11275, partial [Anaerolineae bacterium]
MTEQPPHRFDWPAMLPRLARFLPAELFDPLRNFPQHPEQAGESTRRQMARRLLDAIRALEPLHRALVHYMPRYLIDLNPTPGQPRGEILTGSFMHAD